MEYLKGSSAPRALVNPAAQAEDPHQSFPIDAPVPTDMSQTVVVFRPLFFQHRLSASVSSLLLQISEHRVSPVMPHHCCGVETDLPPALLQSPADINIIPGRAELRIKTPNDLKGCLSERHVAARNVLSLLIRQQNVDGTAGSIGDTISDDAVVRERDIGASYGHVTGGCECVTEICEPVPIRRGIIISIGDDFAYGSCQAGIAGAAQPAILGADYPNSVLLGNRAGRVG